MLELSSNMALNRKMDRSGMSIFGGIDTKFGYLALLDPKLYMKPGQRRPFWISRSSDLMPRIFIKHLLKC